jgi:hypothetical protein
VLLGRGLRIRPITCPEQSYQCGVSKCDHEVMRRPGPLVDVAQCGGGLVVDVKYLNGIEVNPFQLCTAVCNTGVNHVLILKVQ